MSRPLLILVAGGAVVALIALWFYADGEASVDYTCQPHGTVSKIYVTLAPSLFWRGQLSKFETYQKAIKSWNERIWPDLNKLHQSTLQDLRKSGDPSAKYDIAREKIDHEESNEFWTKYFRDWLIRTQKCRAVALNKLSR